MRIVKLAKKIDLNARRRLRFNFTKEGYINELNGAIDWKNSRDHKNNPIDLNSDYG